MLPPLPPAAAPQLSAPRLRAARCPPCAARGRTSRFRHHREPLSCGKRERRRTDTSPADGDENKGVYAEHGRCHRGLPEALPAAPVPAGMATAASPDPPSPEGITCRFAVGNAGPRGFAVVCRAVPASREELSNRPLRDSPGPGPAARTVGNSRSCGKSRRGRAGPAGRGEERREPGARPSPSPAALPWPSAGNKWRRGRCLQPFPPPAAPCREPRNRARSDGGPGRSREDPAPRSGAASPPAPLSPAAAAAHNKAAHEDASRLQPRGPRNPRLSPRCPVPRSPAPRRDAPSSGAVPPLAASRAPAGPPTAPALRLHGALTLPVLGSPSSFAAAAAAPRRTAGEGRGRRGSHPPAQPPTPGCVAPPPRSPALSGFRSPVPPASVSSLRPAFHQCPAPSVLRAFPHRSTALRIARGSSPTAPPCLASTSRGSTHPPLPTPHLPVVSIPQWCSIPSAGTPWDSASPRGSISHRGSASPQGSTSPPRFQHPPWGSALQPPAVQPPALPGALG